MVNHLPVAFDAGCWIWHGDVENTGYGRISRGRGRADRDLAHRWMYKRLVGPIPESLQIDHLCRRKRCVNPAHLEPVTPAENQRRGNAAKLDWDKVEFIRANYIAYDPEWGTNAMSARFGVCRRTIRKVINHLSWTEESRPRKEDVS